MVVVACLFAVRVRAQEITFEERIQVTDQMRAYSREIVLNPQSTPAEKRIALERYADALALRIITTLRHQGSLTSAEYFASVEAAEPLQSVETRTFVSDELAARIGGAPPRGAYDVALRKWRERQKGAK